MSTPAQVDVIVIGAGIVGAACAAECAARGWSVVVVARGICAGATAAGMGHLVVIDDSPTQFAFTKSGVRNWERLAPRLPAAVEYDRCGTLWLASDDQQLAFAEARCQRYMAGGVRAEMITSKQLRHLEPQLIGDLAGALLVPDDAVLYPPAATNYFLMRLRKHGGRLERGDVVSVAANQVILADGRQLTAKYVVVAAGCGSSSLGIGTAVKPRKGHLLITDRYPGYIHHQIIELGYLASAHGDNMESVAFNVQPRAGGQILIGSSRQFGTTDPRTEHHLLQQIVTTATRYVPSIGELQVIRCWSGFRPATSDHLPLIGCSESGVWYATGHEGLGITTAPATAQLLVELMSGDTPHLAAEAFAVDRFHAEVTHV